MRAARCAGIAGKPEEVTCFHRRALGEELWIQRAWLHVRVENGFVAGGNRKEVAIAVTGRCLELGEVGKGDLVLLLVLQRPRIGRVVVAEVCDRAVGDGVDRSLPQMRKCSLALPSVFGRRPLWPTNCSTDTPTS